MVSIVCSLRWPLDFLCRFPDLHDEEVDVLSPLGGFSCAWELVYHSVWQQVEARLVGDVSQLESCFLDEPAGLSRGLPDHRRDRCLFHDISSAHDDVDRCATCDLCIRTDRLSDDRVLRKLV